VLVLGRFREDRKAVLDHIGRLLEAHGYRYLVFDFTEPDDRNKVETIGLLAGLSRFVIADITEPTSVPLELAMIVPQLNIPVVLLAEKGKPTFSLVDDLQEANRFRVFPTWSYRDLDHLSARFEAVVVRRAEKRVGWLRGGQAPDSAEHARCTSAGAMMPPA
jgi:hypothetical protein